MLSIILIFLFLNVENSSPTLICYECWTRSDGYAPSWPPPETWSDCKTHYRARQCSGNFSAVECFSFAFTHEHFEAKGCLTEENLKYKWHCREKGPKLGMHCNTCGAHLCNSAKTGLNSVLLLVILTLTLYTFKK